MKKIILSILASLLICPSVIAGENIHKITLEEAIEIASKNNLEILASQLNAEIAKNDIKTANRFQNPDINIFYNFGRSGKGNPHLIGASQTVEIAKRGARKELAKSNLKLTENSVEHLQFDLRMDVRETYIDLVASKTILKNLEKQKNLFEELVDVAEKKVLTGDLPQVDLMQAKIALNEIITKINTATMAVRAKGLEFNKILNTKLDNYDSIDDYFPENGNFLAMMTPYPEEVLPDFEIVAKKTLPNRIDLKIARQEVDVAKKNLTVIARQRIPDLALMGGYGYQPKDLSDDGTFRAGAYAGVSLVNIPLFYNFSPEIKNARMKVVQAQMRYDYAENNASKDLQKTYEQFLTSQKNLKFYNEKLVKDSDEMIQLSKKEYENGKANITALIVAEQSYEGVLEGYTNAMAEYYKNWVQFMREVNADELNLDTEAI